MRWCCAIALAVVGCAADPQPWIESVFPPEWREPRPAPRITISGEHLHIGLRVNFEPPGDVRTPTRFTGELGGEALEDVVWDNNRQVSATPPRLSAGSHRLTLRTPNGDVAKLNDAVRVLPLGVGAFEGGSSGSTTVPPSSEQGGCDTSQPWEYPVALDPPVEASRSVLFFNYALDSAEPQSGSMSATLDPAGNELIFARGNDGNVGVAVSWSLVQIAGAAIQRGELLDAGTVTLDDPVDPARSFVLGSWRGCGCDYDVGDWGLFHLGCDGDSCDRVEIEVGGDSVVASWQVVELEPETGAAVMSGNEILTVADASAHVTLPSPVDTTASFLVFTQAIRSDNDYEYIANYAVEGDLTDDGTGIDFERQVTSIPESDRVEVEVRWSVVSWPYFLVQRGPIAFGLSQSTVEITLPSPVDPAATLSFVPGSMRQGSTTFIGPDPAAPGCSSNDRVGVAWFQTVLSSDGNRLTIHRGSDVAAARGSWTVVEVL